MAKGVDGETRIPDSYSFDHFTGRNVKRGTWPISAWIRQAEGDGYDKGYKAALRDLQKLGVDLPEEFKKRLIERS